MNDFEQQIQQLQNRLQMLETEREAVLKTLSALKRRQGEQGAEFKKILDAAKINHYSASHEKINLFRDFFKGRTDVYPKRYESVKTGKSGYTPVCANEWRPNICHKPRIKCSECQVSVYSPVTDQVIANHLAGNDNSGKPTGDFVAGVYPLLSNDQCWFLAVDFDQAAWMEDIKAFLSVCRDNQIPCAVERSRSGNGGHAWIFFTEPVMAMEARKLGAFLLTSAMDQHPELSFKSYDRLFPNQDTLPKGGFGNLIALPLQKKAREHGNSVFLDDNLTPYPDQWAYLATITKVTPAQLTALIGQAEQHNKVLGVRLPIEEDDSEPWKLLPSRKLKVPVFLEPLPKTLPIVLGNQIYIDKAEMPKPLQSQIIRLAAFQNPEFYRSQALRLSTHDKPRIIACAEIFSQHIALPRGCLEELIQFLTELGIQPAIQDERFAGNHLPGIEFRGELTDEQKTAVAKLLEHDIGTLAATTAFGKTVVALYILAKRQVNTLIIVHRRQLLDQWLERIELFLNIPIKQVGNMGGGKTKPTGIIDVAIIQSLSKNHEVNDLVANYGLVIFDECHHLSATSFEKVANACKAKYVLGLSATLTRKDGHHPIVFMQCGPIRYQVNAKNQAKQRPFKHWVHQRLTQFQLPGNENHSIHDIYQSLILNNARNDLILTDIKKALAEKRIPLVLTERKEHVTILAEQIATFAKNVFVLQGGMGARHRKELIHTIKTLPEGQERIIIATGKYLGEGFDDARLDTLFLVMPVSWKGTLAQYAGRLHRLHHAKSEVVVYDYVDSLVPMLDKMSDKRKLGYKSLGYTIIDAS